MIIGPSFGDRPRYGKTVRMSARRIAATVPPRNVVLPPARDAPPKTAAVMLQALGFLVLDEILADGTPRRLSRGEARRALDRPWRLSKPGFEGKDGIPDADGAFLSR